jgi:hypothetical protein
MLKSFHMLFTSELMLHFEPEMKKSKMAKEIDPKPIEQGIQKEGSCDSS